MTRFHLCHRKRRRDNKYFLSCKFRFLEKHVVLEQDVTFRVNDNL